MKALRNYLDKIKPNFEEGGKLAMFRSVFDGFETFLFVPNETSKTGVHIHDCIDSKRAMTVVIIALLPALLFGMYNVGYQHNLAVGADPGFLMTFIFGFLAVLPKIIVSYVVGLGIEFAVAQVKKEEIQEGFLVSGILIPMIVPVDTPLWMIAVATAFAVIFAKEVFGGTGYNIFNVALVTRAFLFFAYPAAMSGDQVFVRTADTFGIGAGQVVDGFSGATPLGQVAIAGKEMIGSQEKLKGGFLLDASVGKLIYLNNRKQQLNINLSFNNILNNTSMITGGYQQGRVSRDNKSVTKDIQSVDKFPNKYYYAWGFNMFINVGFKF